VLVDPPAAEVVLDAAPDLVEAGLDQAGMGGPGAGDPDRPTRTSAGSSEGV
jgi:hypothetical protein